MGNRKVFIILGSSLILIAIIGLIYYQIEERREAEIKKLDIIAKKEKEQNLLKEESRKKEREHEIQKKQIEAQKEKERALLEEKLQKQKQQAELDRLKLIQEKEREQAKIAEEARKREEVKKQAEVERKRVAEEARLKKERERENYLNRYLANRSFKNLPNSKETAVLFVKNNKKISSNINHKVNELLKINGFNSTELLFTKHFISDGLFENILKGDINDINKLELPNHCDFIILGKITSKFIENPDMLDLITAKVTFGIHIISTDPLAVENNISINETGAGFSKDDAENLVFEKLLNNIGQQILKSLR